MARYRWIPESKEWIEIDEMYRDPNAGLNGPVWCPENGYYDPVLCKRFETKREKRQYLRVNGLKMQGGDKPTAKKECSTYYSFPGQKTMSRGYKYR